MIHSTHQVGRCEIPRESNSCQTENWDAQDVVWQLFLDSAVGEEEQKYLVYYVHEMPCNHNDSYAVDNQTDCDQKYIGYFHHNDSNCKTEINNKIKKRASVHEAVYYYAES